MGLTIEIADDCQKQAHDHNRLKQAIRSIVSDAGFHSGEISVAIVNDERMHELNRHYLQHDYPTDVLSFVLTRDDDAGSLEGEIIVSAEYAAREAQQYVWQPADELLLYVIHGALHLVGYDDQSPEGRAAMRAAETNYLAQFGLEHRYES